MTSLPAEMEAGWGKKRKWEIAEMVRSDRTSLRLCVVAAGLAIAPPGWALDQSVGAINSGALGDGTGVKIGQIESGHPNTSHQSLPSGQITLVNSPVVRTDHATMVSGVYLSTDGLRTGIAGKADFFSFSRSSFRDAENADGRSPSSDEEVVAGLDALESAFATSDTTVINLSFGLNRTPDGTSLRTRAVDYHALTNDIVMVKSAGNDGEKSPPDVTIPGDCYNCIVVGATHPEGSFNRVWRTSSEGPTADPGGRRNKPDIVAPGVGIDVPVGTYPNSNDFTDESGTSLSTPHVGATAAQIVEFGKARGNATDHKAVKAVLLNSASKDGGEKPGEIRITDKDGGPWQPTIPGTDALDDHMGAGQVNARAARRQYTPEEALLGTDHAPSIDIDPIGWDLATIGPFDGRDFIVDYKINRRLVEDSKLTATLVWDRLVSRTACLAPCLDYEDTFSADTPLTNLDMTLLGSEGIGLGFDLFGRASYSHSPSNSVEHLYFTLPKDDYYTLRITNFGSRHETFGFAVWAHPVPVPAAVIFLLSGLAALSAAKFRQRTLTRI